MTHPSGDESGHVRMALKTVELMEKMTPSQRLGTAKLNNTEPVDERSETREARATHTYIYMDIYIFKDDKNMIKYRNRNYMKL